MGCCGCVLTGQGSMSLQDLSPFLQQDELHLCRFVDKSCALSSQQLYHSELTMCTVAFCLLPRSSVRSKKFVESLPVLMICGCSYDSSVVSCWLCGMISTGYKPIAYAYALPQKLNSTWALEHIA